MTTATPGQLEPADAERGVVARMSSGEWTDYHRCECPNAPQRGEAGVRDTIHAPWRYLAAHWRPCPICRPPMDAKVPRAA